MDLLSQIRKSVASIALTAMSFGFFMPMVSAARLDFTDASEIPTWAIGAI